MVPPYTKMAGMSIRAIAIMAPGMFLSQPPTASTPSMLWAPQAVSIESAMTSRETSEYFIPSVPMRDAVAHRDGAEDLRHGARGAHGLLRRVGQLVEAGVAGGDGAVRVGDADDGLPEIVVAEPHGAKHGTVGGALDALGDGGAFEVVGHGGMYGKGR